MTSPSRPHAPAEALSRALDDGQTDKRLEVLRRIAGGVSISQAARDAGISYKAAWQAIDTLSNLCGRQLVTRTVGGAGGGGATVTPEGRELLALADALAQARAQVLARFAGRWPARAGGLGLRTSMRNQLPCEVQAGEPATPDDPMVMIRLRTAGGALLAASVTRESADLLALQPGSPALVLCKATAVQVQTGALPAAGDATRGAAVNRLAGRIDRIARGQQRDEVVLALDGGGQWVGFAPHPFTARRGQRAWAGMDMAALVVARGD